MRILLLNQFIKNYSGSEINAIQLALALRALGHDADIATFFYGAPLKELVEEKGIRVIELFNDVKIPLQYDLVWAHHSPVLTYTLFKTNILDTRILFSSLSTFIPLEGPPAFHYAIQYFLAISKENVLRLVQNGVQREKIHYFPNYAPAILFTKSKTQQPGTPTKIAVISNHPPDELRAFALIAQKNNIQVDFIGFLDTPIFVDENLLLNYDLVITIGKTVQYCFALKIPVYCYDYFGGPGYISPENIEESASSTFSGRGSNRTLSGEGLYQDITSNFGFAIDQLNFLYNKCSSDYCLETNIRRIETEIFSIPITNIEKLRETYSYADRINDIYIDELKRGTGSFEFTNYNAARDIRYVLAEKDQEILNYATSKSWEYTRPFRKIGRILKKGNK